MVDIYKKKKLSPKIRTIGQDFSSLKPKMPKATSATKRENKMVRKGKKKGGRAR
jgi:hypothetical protein